MLSHTNMVEQFEFIFIRIHFHFSILVRRFFLIFLYTVPFRCRFFSFRFIRNLLIFIFSDITYDTFVRLPMLGPGNARWLCLSSSFSHSPVLSILSRPWYPLSHSPLLPLLASATPLPPSLSLSLSPSLARLIDPDPVLFSSLFDSRRVTRAPTHPPPHDGKGCPEGEGVGGWRRKREAVGGTGRTGPTHRSRDIHFHFIFLARYRRQRKKERGNVFTGRGQEKFRPFPRDRLDSLSGSRESEFAIFATSPARL